MSPLPPALLILFGTTGDLARKKLIPALFTLFCDGYLDPAATVLGVGRRDWSDEEYRTFVVSSVRAVHSTAANDLDSFAGRCLYHRLDMNNPAGYPALWQRIDALEHDRLFTGNRLFFLATAPDLFPVAAGQLGRGQPMRPGFFRRLMIEKPFGHDLASARSFNESLRTCFAEQEIFRIDHYLGKEMLQNILVLRFANRLFEPIWRRDSLDHIQITVAESIGIDQRGGYYDQAGALRDMVQSHLLQLLALLVMERPTGLEVEGIRNEKARLLRSIRPFDETAARSDAVLGQYGPGPQAGGYLEETGIAPGSRTETFAALKLWLDNDRWQGMPVYLRTGKRLDQNTAKITLVFKHEPYRFLARFDEPNLLVIRIQPQEGIDLRFNIKQPGMTAAITQVKMDFCQNCDPAVASPAAYEKLLFDAWSGDLNLFTRWDEIEAAWTLIDSLQRFRDRLPVPIYPAGSAGPAAADLLLSRDGRRWLDL